MRDGYCNNAWVAKMSGQVDLATFERLPNLDGSVYFVRVSVVIAKRLAKAYWLFILCDEKQASVNFG